MPVISSFPRWASSLVVALFLVVGGCDSTDPKPPANPTDAVYVCNQAGATVSVIDPASHEVVQTVDLTDHGFSSGAKPHDVAVEPDGSAWYVSLIGDNAIAKFNARNELTGTVDFVSPGMLSLDPTSELLYAGHTMSLPNVPSTLAAVDRTDMSPIQVPLSVPIDRPHGMRVAPNGQFAYSTSLSTNRIVAIDTETQTVHSPVDLPGSQQIYVQLTVGPESQTAYVTGDRGNQVHVLDLQDPTAPSLLDSVSVDGRPWHPTLSEDGTTLYFGNKATHSVTAMNTETLDTTRISGPGLATPHGSARSPDGKSVYVSNTNVNGSYDSSSGAEIGTVVVIDTDTHNIESVIDVGEEPAGLATRARP